jgi:hypothetical protein
MMRCIEAGGLFIVKSNRSQGVHYELPRELRRPTLEDFRGECFKLYPTVLNEYELSSCNIVFMDRNPYKILVSYLRHLQRIPFEFANCRRSRHGWKFDFSVYEKSKKVWKEKWEKEANSVSFCQLEDMQTHDCRIEFFNELKEKGWPIDVEKAALVENNEEELVKRQKNRPVW